MPGRQRKRPKEKKVPHPTLEAVKAQFDEIERSLIDKISRGRVADWAEYRQVVGQLQEVREGRARVVEILKKMLEEA